MEKHRRPPTPDAMANTEACAGCGKKMEGMKQCGRCMEVKYCTRDCQVADWRMHKLACCPELMGEDIDEELAAFVNFCTPSQLTQMGEEQEDSGLKRFVSSNPWPSKQEVCRDLRSDNFFKLMSEVGSDGHFDMGDGTKFYNHTLGKELFNAWGVSDPGKHVVALRRVGWKIKAHGERVAGERDLRGIRRCMLLHFCLLGVIIKRSVTPSQASDFNNVFVARLIWAWDGIGPWKTRL